MAQYPGQLPERLAHAVASPLTYQQAIGTLRRYGLIKASEESLSVHRLVQAVIRHQLTSTSSASGRPPRCT
jgi:hypothetical protein